MNKEQYLQYARQHFSGATVKLLEKQIEIFYQLAKQKIEIHPYKVGDLVNLSAETYLHGLGSNVTREIIDLIAQQGLISQDYERDASKHFTHHTISLWHVRQNISLGDYIKNYSGIEVCYNGQWLQVPYGQLDKFVEKMRSIDHWLWKAESSMEIRFMPSLARDQNQLAFIINGRDPNSRQLFQNNLLDDNFPFELAQNFLNFKDEKQKQEFQANRTPNGWERIAYLIFGVPRSLIEGILVGREFEHNSQVLSYLKEKFPNCYICNLDGKVIVT